MVGFFGDGPSVLEFAVAFAIAAVLFCAVVLAIGWVAVWAFGWGGLAALVVGFGAGAWVASMLKG